ncbi:MAG: ferritin-like domain-containing protein [Deltaproteobacteria bacterium]|nr:ferritin-like domain-containing protein [Deltaproteobacteria bacterium]
MKFTDRLTVRFASMLASTPQGRAHILNLASDAEGSDEGRIFDAIEGLVTDDALKKVVQRHRDDELRHQKLFGDAAIRNGGTLHPAPPELRLLDRIDARTGGFLSKPITTERDAAMAYLVLLVIEERALNQFALLEQAFRPIDPESADVFVQISKDEARHLRYCHAVAKKYLPDDAQREAEIVRLRNLEAEAFRENQEAMMRYAFEHNLVPGGFTQAIWGFLGSVGRTIGGLPFTRFASEPLPALAPTGA